MNTIPNLTLWGVGTSRTIRPHWAMHELGLAYETKPIGPRTGETKTAEYTKLNPRQKVPLLQDGDFCIGESAAIVAYLSRMYSTTERSLIPEATIARVRQIISRRLADGVESQQVPNCKAVEGSRYLFVEFVIP